LENCVGDSLGHRFDQKAGFSFDDLARETKDYAVVDRSSKVVGASSRFQIERQCEIDHEALTQLALGRVAPVVAVEAQIAKHDPIAGAHLARLLR
jgi:hypothetical protein